MTIARLHAGPRMSQAVIHNDTVYLAGQVADEAKGRSVTEQTREILASVDRLLQEAGSDKTKILSTTIYLGRYRDLRRNERGLGRLGPGGPCARPRDGRSEARCAGLHGRDRLHRRPRLKSWLRKDAYDPVE